VCRAHVVKVMLCAFGIVYMLYSGVVYMWRCVHIVQVVSCTCGFVHTLCRWLQCTCGTYGNGVDACIAWCCIMCVVVCV